MGSYRNYSCPNCRFDVRIGGPEEFYCRPSTGELSAYGHPEAESAEALAHGIDGFWMHLWCDGCQAVKRMTTMEFVIPCDPLDAWAGRAQPRPGFPNDAESCPDCKAPLNDEIPGVAPPCPSCRAATLQSGRLVE